jgi:hypothetical protein
MSGINSSIRAASQDGGIVPSSETRKTPVAHLARG